MSSTSLNHRDQQPSSSTQLAASGGGGGGGFKLKGRQSKIKLNILGGLTYFACDTTALHRSKESKFASKLVVVPNAREYLRVYTFPNDICLLTISELLDPSSVCSVRFLVDISDDSISGKKKRGAVLLKAGHNIAALRLTDGSELIVSTPIGGHLLEVNSKLAEASGAGLNLLTSDPSGAGYFAVVKPNCQFPTSDFPNYASLVAHLSEKQERVCFSWKSSGTCEYGNNCKFNHPVLPPASDFNNNSNTSQDDKMVHDAKLDHIPSDNNSSDEILASKRKIEDTL